VTQTVVVFGFKLSLWLVIPLIYLLWSLVLLTAKRIAFRAIRRMASRTKTDWDDHLIEAADLPLTIWIMASGAPIVSAFIPKGDLDLTRYFSSGFKAVTIIAIVVFIDKFIGTLIGANAQRIELLKTSGGIAQGLSRLIIFALGALILLDSFHVSITPIIASLGIGSLAIALSLQPTLENLFAGIQIVVDKPLLVGQYVKLESGEEGYVHQIGWRSTWVRMTPNNMVVIPNKSLVNSRLINYHYPDAELAVPVEVGVHYDSDLERVERITLEVARQTLQDVSGGVKTFEPAVRFHTFDASSINFTVVLRAREVGDSAMVKHEFIKQLHRRYIQEKIVIPYPIRAINYEQEKARG